MHNLLRSREFADLLIFSSHKLRTRWFVCPVLSRLSFVTNEKEVAQDSRLRMVVMMR